MSLMSGMPGLVTAVTSVTGVNIRGPGTAWSQDTAKCREQCQEQSATSHYHSPSQSATHSQHKLIMEHLVEAYC